MKYLSILTILMAAFCSNHDLFAQKTRQISVGYTCFPLESNLVQGYSSAFDYLPKQSNSSFGLMFEMLSTQKINVNAPAGDNSGLEYIFYGLSYKYRVINAQKITGWAGLNAGMNNVKYARSTGGNRVLLFTDPFIIVDDRETLVSANSVNVQPTFTLNYNIKNNIGISVQARYRIGTEDTKILNRSQLSGSQFSVMLYCLF
ncbi:MAG: hypothetical protein RIR11_2026 [Bacteroidota bacterium]|jgi:hypothetical protein